mgnify:CR=1 FL=1
MVRLMRVSLVLVMTAVVGPVAHRRSAELRAQAPIQCDLTSSDSHVARVQKSSALRDAVRRIAATTYAPSVPAFEPEFQRICMGLLPWTSPALPGLWLVYATAYQGIQDIPVIFGVGPHNVVILNAIPGDSLNPSIDKASWNHFVTHDVQVSLQGPIEAAAEACLIYTMYWVSFPQECTRPPPSATYAAHQWHVWIVDTMVRLGVDGTIKSLDGRCAGDTSVPPIRTCPLM